MIFAAVEHRYIGFELYPDQEYMNDNGVTNLIYLTSYEKLLLLKHVRSVLVKEFQKLKNILKNSIMQSIHY